MISPEIGAVIGAAAAGAVGGSVFIFKALFTKPKTNGKGNGKSYTQPCQQLVLLEQSHNNLKAENHQAHTEIKTKLDRILDWMIDRGDN
jgi:hypothetical protein